MPPPRKDSRLSHSRICQSCDLMQEERRKCVANNKQVVCSVCHWGVDETSISPYTRFRDTCTRCRRLSEGEHSHDPNMREERQRYEKIWVQNHCNSRPPSYRTIESWSPFSSGDPSSTIRRREKITGIAREEGRYRWTWWRG